MSATTLVSTVVSTEPVTTGVLSTDLSQQTQALERHGYLFGQKIAASMSPVFHQTIFNDRGWAWEQFRLDSADIPSFLRLLQDPNCFGTFQGIPVYLTLRYTNMESRFVCHYA
ncbi:hypothetical protein NPX13_g4862 [Xylaria arbuscula]|uniref:Uncharacterized protein n=1 Tax=Xylaria arbuscula TaxID=114810 RepID=A0A9W8TMX4_9PEZI|nr:hypothetical protein NPX13_g4862 [Xylaria arbuscula]